MKTIVFDLDNTLIECGKYYQQATNAVVLYLMTETHLPENLVREMVEHVDLAGTVLQDGFQRARFPRACTAASYALDGMQGNTPNHKRGAHAGAIAERVFDAPYEIYPGVEQMLTVLRREGWQLAILTKGDTEVQLNKLKQFVPYVDMVRVVPKKTAAELDGFLTVLRADRNASWVVGDSKRDDIAPARALGIRCVWVENPSSSWGYESVEVVPSFSVEAAADLMRDPHFVVRRRKLSTVNA